MNNEPTNQDTDQKAVEENTSYKPATVKSQSVAKQPKEKEPTPAPVVKETPANPPSRFKVIPVSNYNQLANQ